MIYANIVSKTLICLLVFNTLLGATNANAFDKLTVQQENHFGCSSKDYFKQVRTYIWQKDNVAFENALVLGVATGECTIFKRGETVYAVGHGMGIIKLRREGEMSEYWTFIETVEP
ncbi:MAG TPA: hypothetical protein EYQ41_01905 [Micavibrio sp.]|nr:hypothetical protein [Micavibrio sp.]